MEGEYWKPRKSKTSLEETPSTDFSLLDEAKCQYLQENYGHLKGIPFRKLWDDAMSARGKTTLDEGPQLTTDLWQLVASHLTTKEWRAVSNACKAMRSVDPVKIDVTVERLEDLKWTMRHWAQARSLSIAMQFSEKRRSQELTALHMLEACESNELPFLKDARFTGPWSMICFMEAPLLERMHLRVDLASVFSVPVSLRHLILDVGQEFLTCEREQWCKLVNLETLHISFRPQADGSIVCESLCLDKCQALRFLHLVNVVPEEMCLPKSCQCSLELSSEEFARYSKESLLELQLCLHEHDGALCVHEERSFNKLLIDKHWFRKLLGWGISLKLKHLRLQISDDMEVPLAMTVMPELTDLELISDADDGNVVLAFQDGTGQAGYIPRKLERLIMIGSRLKLIVPDVASFAESLKVVYMRWQERCSAVCDLLGRHLCARQRWFPRDKRFTEACVWPHGESWGDMHDSLAHIGLHWCGCHRCVEMDNM